MLTNRAIETRKGQIRFPAYIPVTTFGEKYPLDRMIRPYLPRLSQAVMVSYYYAKQMKDEEKPRLPMLVDSGGFVSLFQNATVETDGKLGIIKIERDDGIEIIHPNDVLELQETIADIAFTLDFPIPPGLELGEAHQRLDLTISNAYWALQNRRRKDMPLYACVQAWDAQSALDCMHAYKGADFDGFAIGGLVPRARDKVIIEKIVNVVRQEARGLPVHVFGLGKPETTQWLFQLGVDSVDSSAYVKMAADGRLWSDASYHFTDPSPTDRLHLALINLATATEKKMPLSTTSIVSAAISSSRTALIQA